jgi:uncharacterized protein
MIDNSPQLTVRKLEIDIESGFDRHWHGGDAFLSQYYNALSMSFPAGEQSFIDAVRDCSKLLPDTAEYAQLRATVAQFIGQEATHRRIHNLYNEHLTKQGLVNHWESWINKRLAFAKKRNIKPIHMLAVTAAIEHCTAVFADGTHRYESWFDGADEKMKTLWYWHTAEETEHKAVAFDVYQAIGGNYAWRIRWYIYVVVLFGFEAFAQTCNNLWHDGSLFKPSTWWGAAKFLVGKNGFVWRCTMPLLAYFKRDFHPNHDPFGDNHQRAAKWLETHTSSWRAVR